MSIEKMKNRLKKAVSYIVLAGLFLCLLTIVPAAELKASFSLKGPSSLRAGDSVTIQIKADGEGVLGIRAEVTYDKNQLTYSSSSGTLSKWKVEITEENGKLSIWAEENNDFKSPINSSVTLIKLNFKASEKLKENDSVSVKLKVLEASSTEDSIENISATYSVKVSKPLSDNCDLSSLSVDGYNLVPDFSPDITDYEIDEEVAFTQSSLKVTAKASDSEASVDVSGARLSVGENTIKIKVTAEDGKTAKTYKIKAVMAQDPDYVPSSDATLSEIALSEGKLSPAFSPDIFDYIVYVPYETVSVSVSASVSDSRSTPPENVDTELDVGDNPIALTCAAEDGTTATYIIHVTRMPGYFSTDTEGSTDTDNETGTETDTTDTLTDTDTDTDTGTATQEPPVTVDTETEPVTKEPVITEPEDTVPGTDKTDKSIDDSPGKKTYPLWALFAAAGGGLVLGGAVSILVFNFSNERKQ